MHHLRRCIVTVLLAIATTAATAESPHTIRLIRPVEVGHGFHVRATGSADLTTTVVTGGREIASTVNLSATFDAVGRVIKVDDAGRPMGIAYTINECKMRRNGYTSTIIPQGETLIAREGRSQTSFFVKQMRFTEYEHQALETVAGMETYRATKDELFGSDRPRSAGEQWPIDSVAVAAEFQLYTPQNVDPDNINGSTTFLELIDYEGQRCQVLRIEFTSSGALPGYSRMPPGTRLKSADIKATIHDLLPVDTRQPRLAEKFRVELDVTVSDGMRGQTLEVRLKGVLQSERTYSAITLAQAAVEP